MPPEIITPEKKIIHIDMDCFYAAVEVRDRPDLKGQCVAVGGSPEGRGVIATSNYEARKFGVRSAMSTSTALRKCPQLILVRPNFEKYKKVSRQIHEVFKKYTDLIEPLSLDEAFLDVTKSPSNLPYASQIAAAIRKEIFEITGLTCSAGIAPNKFLAKVASEWKKPNGQYTIPPSKVAQFVETLPVRSIPGVGPITEKKMLQNSLKTCGDLQKLSLGELSHLFGSWGADLFERARGIDRRSVKTERAAKSLSTERTFPKDLETEKEVLREFKKTLESLRLRLNKKNQGTDAIAGIFIKIKDNDFRIQRLDRAMKGFPEESTWVQLLEDQFFPLELPLRLLGCGIKWEYQAQKKSGPQLSFQIENSP